MIADVSCCNASCPRKEKSEEDEDDNANPFLESESFTFPSDKGVEHRANRLFDDREATLVDNYERGRSVDHLDWITRLAVSTNSRTSNVDKLRTPNTDANEQRTFSDSQLSIVSLLSSGCVLSGASRGSVPDARW